MSGYITRVFLDAKYDLLAAGYCACDVCVEGFTDVYRNEARQYARDRAIEIVVETCTYGGPEESHLEKWEKVAWQDIHDRVSSWPTCISLHQTN